MASSSRTTYARKQKPQFSGKPVPRVLPQPPDPPNLIEKPMRELSEIRVGSVWIGEEKVIVKSIDKENLDVVVASLATGDEKRHDYWAFQCLYDLREDLR